MKLKGKTVVITGASSGIGRLAALEFAKQGANLALIARDRDALESLADEIFDVVPGSCIAIPTDVTDYAAVRRASETTAARFGRIDFWINNAGVSLYAETWNTPLEDLRRVMDVNFFGQVHGVLSALPYLERSGGQIIAILSVESEIALPFQAAYTASKHALYGYYKTLHEELLHRRSPVTVSTLLPASISTPLFENAKTRLGVRPRPFPPVYSPNRVVDAILDVIRHPRFSTVVGKAGRNAIALHRRNPELFYGLMARIGYVGQMSREDKTAYAPNNLVDSVPGTDHVFGKNRPNLIANLTDKHPRISRGLAFALIAFVYTVIKAKPVTEAPPRRIAS